MSSSDRLLPVLALLRSPGGQTLRSLAQRFGVSKGAIQRDLDYLSRQGVEVREERHGQTLCYFVDGAAPLHPVPPAVALPVAALSVLHPWRRAGWCKSVAAASPGVALVDAAGPEPRSAGGVRVTEAVSCALVSHRLLRLTYRTGGGGGRKRATVEPIRLRTAAGLQYLDAYRREDGAFRTYALHRCVEARALQGTFVPRPVPPRTAFGALEGEARAVHVRFAPEVANFIAERVWHPSQHVVRRSDGALDWTATVSGLEEFLGWVMSWSPWAELKTPADWRDQLVGRAKAVLAQHGDERRRPSTSTAPPRNPTRSRPTMASHAPESTPHHSYSR
jgi:predicted DNA-binding transcriptional regulator YafY